MISTARKRKVMTVLMAALLLLATGAHAASDENTGQAERWLARLGPALNMTTYRGVLVYTRGEQISSMRVAHRYLDGHVEERLVQQDGASGEFVRKGDRVVCVLPDRGRFQLDPIIPSGPFAEAFASRLVPDNPWYQPELLGDDRVAGYAAKVVALKARDTNRYSYRLWLEQDTGLLLKSHVRSADGHVLESFQFTDLEITDTLPDSEFEVQGSGREMSAPASSDVIEKNSTTAMSGWRLGWKPDGFVPAAALSSGNGQSVAFSDGLAAFSVFVEPAGDLDMPTGASRIGATTAYMRRLTVGEATFLVTVIGEIPPETAMRVAESVKIKDTLALRREAQ